MGKNAPKKKKVGGTSVHAHLADHDLSHSADFGADFERAHVSAVYDTIAEHFSDTRAALWPIVARFCAEIAPSRPSAGPWGSLVADIGCGNGKYLNALREGPPPARNATNGKRSTSKRESEDLTKSTMEHSPVEVEGETSLDGTAEGSSVLRFAVGVDRSAALLSTCVKNAGKNRGCLLQADGIALPFRAECFDGVISVAVVHHFSSPERRLAALAELCRIVRPGGCVLVTVWALEQARKEFPDQDVFVPWHFQHRFGSHSVPPGSSTSAATSPGSSNGADSGSPGTADMPTAPLLMTPGDGGGNGPVTVFQRYYHLFVEGELEKLFHRIPHMEVIDSAYDRDNCEQSYLLHWRRPSARNNTFKNTFLEDTIITTWRKDMLRFGRTASLFASEGWGVGVDPSISAVKYRVRSQTLRGLLREALFASRDWPAGEADAKRRIRKLLDAQKDVTNEYDRKLALRRGRWMVEQMHELSRFHRYREMKKRYGQ